MVHSASMYGIGDGLAPLRGGRDLAYDTYVEQAKTRAAAQASVAFQALQTGLLSQMSNSMNAIHAQMEEARQQQSEALAIQQKLLSREQMQSHLEEFIYQAEKLIAECSKSGTGIPLSSRYFLLLGVLGKIEQDGIDTAVIRGRENKAAFEKVVRSTQKLTQALLKEPEVQDAVRWAEKERKRLEAEHARAEQDRQSKIKALEKRLAGLQGELKSVSMADEFARRIPIKTEHKVPLIVAGFFLFPLLVFLIPVGVIFAASMFFDAKKRMAELNRGTYEQIATVQQRLSELRGESEA